MHVLESAGHKDGTVARKRWQQQEKKQKQRYGSHEQRQGRCDKSGRKTAREHNIRAQTRVFRAQTAQDIYVLCCS
jgi:hypothetical protein